MTSPKKDRCIRLGNFVVEIAPLPFRPVRGQDFKKWAAETPIGRYEIFQLGNQWFALATGHLNAKISCKTLAGAIGACNERHRDIVLEQIRVRDFAKPLDVPCLVEITINSQTRFWDALNDLLAEGGCLMCGAESISIKRKESGKAIGTVVVCDFCGRTLVEVGLAPAELME